MPLELKLAVAGLLVGTLVGLTGMGGGAVMTPLLIFMGIPAVQAVGTDLAYSAVTKTVGAWRHHTLRHVNYRIALWLGLGSVPASVVGVFTLDRLEHAAGTDVETLIRDVLGAALVVVGATLLVRTLLHRRARPGREIETRLERRQKLLAVGVGLVFGYVLGLTSVGSGTFFGMALLLFFPLSASRVVGTDTLHAAVLVWAAALAHAAAGNVDLGSVSWLLVGSVPGILLGAQFTGRAPERVLRIALSVVLAVSGVALLRSA